MYDAFPCNQVWDTYILKYISSAYEEWFIRAFLIQLVNLIRLYLSTMRVFTELFTRDASIYHNERMAEYNECNDEEEENVSKDRKKGEWNCNL